MSETREELQVRLGIKFNNPELLAEALRHKSVSPLGKKNKPQPPYERLEFFGDAVIDYVVSKRLFRRSPPLSQGRMTQAFTSLASRMALGELAEEIDLFPHIEFCPGFGDNMSIELRHNVVGDVYEALVGAIHEDQGFETAENFVERTAMAKLDELLAGKNLLDHKNQLSRFLQGRHHKRVYPEYQLIGRKSDGVYVSQVSHDGKNLGQGEGKTQTASELNAAKEALEILKKR
ncbi:MAG: ribonuclease III domain-containing protein [Candidatus Paceibacterota bacterium]|jgi:ribonuclease-3